MHILANDFFSSNDTIVFFVFVFFLLTLSASTQKGPSARKRPLL